MNKQEYKKPEIQELNSTLTSGMAGGKPNNGVENNDAGIMSSRS